ncbi:MAG: MFS transporter [Calditrichales bacterium]|nr:MAG: MFS transporter [Calditrichales bacterium]
MNTVLTSTPQEPSKLYRWIVLLFVSLAMFGNYYIYDSIAPIADMLKSNLGFTDENIGQMYSMYSIAAIIVLLLGGVFIDKYGTKISIVIFAAISTFAAVVTWVSPDLTVMLTGRVLLGLGSEPLIVAITTALAKWFKGKELSFAFGINLTIARLGSVAADNSPSWAGSFYSNWQDPLFLAMIISIACVVGGGVYWFLENRAEKKFALATAGETDKFVFKDLFGFGKSFWFIVALCVTFYSAIFPFRSFAIKFFIEAHGATREFAGFMNSILPMSAMIATPLFGLLADKIGKRALLMAVASVIILPVYLMMVYSGVSLYVPIVMMGIAFSLIPAVMWPSVAYIVDERKLGTAYSVMTLIQQIGVALFNWMIGKSNDVFGASAQNPEGYTMGMWLFSILGIVGLVFAILLRKQETGPHGHGLELSMAERQLKG